MHKIYGHLTFEERVSIRVLGTEGKSIREIARRLSRDASTISRELKRNIYWAPSQNEYPNYLPAHAHVKARKRRRREYCKYPKLLLKSKKNQRYVERQLKLGWSPELISGRMKREKISQPVSHESIYQWLYKERRDLLMYLTRHHKRRKRRGQSKKFTKICYDKALSVRQRAKRINDRTEFGHWESDSMVSDQSLAALHVVVERKSRYAIVSKLKRNASDDVKNILIRRMKRLPKKARNSFTFDRGGENTKHQEISSSLQADAYFCTAYRGWEKGTVENTIGLIRRKIKKRTDLGQFSSYDIRLLQNQLNKRPRKCLDFKTPNEVFKDELVALQY